MAIIFDGNQRVGELKEQLRGRVAQIQEKMGKIVVATVVFRNDPGSMLYTEKKAAFAREVGIEYRPYFFEMDESGEIVRGKIEALNNDPEVTGVMIQKPTRRAYEQFWQEKSDEAGEVVKWGEKSYNQPLRGSEVDLKSGRELSFDDWWRSLVEVLSKEKDVDGLSPGTLTAIERGTWQEEGRVLPATVRAILSILEEARQELGLNEVENARELGKMVIVGKSDLVGFPLAGEARRLGYEVELWGKANLEREIGAGRGLSGALTVVSATGKPNLITGEMIDEGVILIDVGEPQGDLDFESCVGKAAFITSVPGGVGPVTVLSLFENALDIKNKTS